MNTWRAKQLWNRLLFSKVPSDALIKYRCNYDQGNNNDVGTTDEWIEATYRCKQNVPSKFNRGICPLDYFS